MHPLDEIIEDNFHRPKQQRRRSSLDNSCLSAQESILSLIPDIDDYEHSSAKRRFSLNGNENKTCTFLAEIFPTRSSSKKDLDLDFHASTHGEARPMPDASGRYSSRHTNNKIEEEASGETLDTLDSSESILGDDDDSCDSFCDAEAGEPANRSYLRQDLGASCFWDDDMYDIQDESEREEEKVIAKSLPQANERIQAALSRVRNGKKGNNNATGTTEASTTTN